jgi:two-component system response regulator HydG
VNYWKVKEYKMKKILVVDDRVEVLRAVGRFLIQNGFVVYLSDSVEKALSLCKKMKFDMVVSDFELGEISGIELINKIREKHPRIKAILMSGSFDFDRKMLERREIDAFLQKPFEVKELEVLIKSVLGK